MAPKSIWRQPNAVHFQVVHRSQRDVRKDDPDASAHVLKPYEPLNRTKGKSRADLEQDDPTLAASAANPQRSNLGEAALYGVYYDDTEYDYMQHLRAIPDSENSRRGGVDEDDDTEAVWIPSAVQPKDRAPRFALKEEAERSDPRLMLPASVFASQEAPLEQMYGGETHGLQPDMDPHLRQTLEALDDDAFVADDADDDFFAGIVRDGTWDGQRTEDDSWRDAPPEGDAIWLDPLQRALKERTAAGDDESALSLEARVALFKARAAAESDGTATDDEDQDTLGELPPAAPRAARAAGSVSSTGSALGRKGAPGALALRAASTRAGSTGGGSTVWSMTSSSMARNEQLSDLDARFDQVIRAYGGHATGDPMLDALHGAFDGLASEEEEEEDELDHETAERLTREDLDAILDDFLEHHEVIGGQLKPTLGDRSTTADEKLSMLRVALGEARITDQDDENEEGLTPASENPFLNPDRLRADREQWDVETIQTTKTNLENHPRTISAAESVATRGTGASLAPGRVPGMLDDPGMRLPKIRIHPRTGLPQVVGYINKPPTRKSSVDAQANAPSPELSARPVRVTTKRDRNESHEERRARKEAQKIEKQQRRQAKTAVKQVFADEHKRQAHASRRQAEARGGGAALHLA